VCAHLKLTQGEKDGCICDAIASAMLAGATFAAKPLLCSAPSSAADDDPAVPNAGRPTPGAADTPLGAAALAAGAAADAASADFERLRPYRLHRECLSLDACGAEFAAMQDAIMSCACLCLAPLRLRPSCALQ
jgi:hypothetical protein